MSDTWQALTDTQALKELAGLRGIAPSVRCLEILPQQTTKTKVYHVRQNQQIYLWGVEMFQGGYDCVEIKKINNDGTETYEKLGGKYISDFIENDKMVYNNNLIEYPSFSDFWSEPFLIDTIDEDGTDKKIIKSNFHRCFVFPNEGFYKIILNERLNPQTGEFGFVADYSQPQYKPISLIFSRNKSSTDSGEDSGERAPIQRVLTDGEFRRQIIIRVIGENNDIITNTPLTTVTKDLGSKKLSKGELVTGSVPNPNFSITDVYPKRTIFKNGIIKTDLWDTNSVFDYTQNNAPAGTRQVSYDNISQLYFLFNLDPILDTQLDTFTNTPDLEYHPLNRHLYIGKKKSNNGEYFSSTTFRNGTTNNFADSTEIEGSELKIINMRNLIIENVTFIGSDHGADGNSSRSFPYRSSNPNQTITFNNALIDISGSILRNCTFIGSGHGFFTNQTYREVKTGFITDGSVVENCKFINTSFLTGISCDGLLVKNCTWESPVRRSSPSVISIYGGDSNCFMGNTFKCLGRSFFLDAAGPIVNNCTIRCTTMLHGNHHTAGEILVIDQPQLSGYGGSGFFKGVGGDTRKWITCGYMSILNSVNSGGTSSYSISSYFAGCKLNFCAFNADDVGGTFYLRGVNAGINSLRRDDVSGSIIEDSTGRYADFSFACEYNVYMHNYSYTMTSSLFLGPNANYNRILNCVFGNPASLVSTFSSYPYVSASYYTFGSLFSLANSGENTTTSDTSGPISNLVNNCVIVDNADQFFKPKLSWIPINHSEYYGPRSSTQNGFKLNIFKYRTDTGAGAPDDGEFPSGLSNTELMNRLNGLNDAAEKENVLHNLTKISLRHT